MLINPDLLIAWGGKSKKFKRNEFIFSEDQEPKWFYQILEGKVRMFNVNPEGREYTQGIFVIGDCFGEPALLIGEPYPATAEALENSVLQMLPKDTFFAILKEYPEIQNNLMIVLAKRIYSKSVSSKSIINCRPETRILGFLDNIKKGRACEKERILVPFTRQEIADFTGLRVETVIRTLNKMKDKTTLEIINHKVYF